MQKPPIAFRADGNAQIGLGHIHRCLTLASYLKDNFLPIFYVFEPDELVKNLIQSAGFTCIELKCGDYEEPENFTQLLNENAIVVLDGYNFKTEYQRALKLAGCKVIAIDDLNAWYNVADVVINHAYSGNKNEYNISEQTELCSGLKFAIVKQEIFSGKRHLAKTENKNVLVCIGGTDPDNYSEKIVNELLRSTNKNISLLTYPLNRNFNKLKEIVAGNCNRLKLFHSLNTTELIELIRNNDISILQPSNIALEASAIGIYLGLIQTAENQKFIMQALLNSQCAEILNISDLASAINGITVEQINSQIKNQSILLDGRSSVRLVSVFNRLELRVRKVEEEDVARIFVWNNDPITRANSYNRNLIPFSDHEKWFSNKIKDPDTLFLMLEFRGQPAGCVRIDNKKEENVIGITVAPDFRGRKLASLMLDMATKEYFKVYPADVITAYIKKSNEASLKSFINAGFNTVEEGEYFGELSYKLIKRIDG